MIQLVRGFIYLGLPRDFLYQAIIAFPGKHEDGSRKVTEAMLNRFPSAQIDKKFQQDPYRFLIVADKLQTGYDEPLLHTMYVDKQFTSTVISNSKASFPCLLSSLGFQ